MLPAAWQYSEPHERADRPGIACTYVRLFDVRYRLDDIRDGDYPHDDVREHLIDCTPDDEATAVDLAVDGLRDYGLSADDSCRWFFDPDGSQVVNHYTGEHSEVTGHLYGFAQAEQTRIRQKIITNS